MDEFVRFVDGPTRIEVAQRLATSIGLLGSDLLVKRDDLIGLGGGGNKVRKLQYSCGAAVRAGAGTLVTAGAPHSNQCRLTAAAGARLGLEVILVLKGDEPATRRGKLLLDQLFGARIVWSGQRAVDDQAQTVMNSLAGNGVNAYRIPFGGSSPSTARGYADAAHELLQQVPDLEQVVVAVGSGATMAGLVSVLGAERVLGIDTGAVDNARRTVSGLLNGMSGVSPVRAGLLRLDPGQIGRGYAHLTPATRHAIERAARTEGLILDPTYTGRAMAGLIAAVESGDVRPGQRTVFLHTGGMPGLFGHPEID
jgi:D-cysteine desulfhydrase